jgi:hypothetical protein
MSRVALSGRWTGGTNKKNCGQAIEFLAVEPAVTMGPIIPPEASMRESYALISTEALSRELGRADLRIYDCTTYLEPAPPGSG